MDVCLGATLIIYMCIIYILMIFGYIGIRVAFILLFLSSIISIIILLVQDNNAAHRHDH